MMNMCSRMSTSSISPVNTKLSIVYVTADETTAKTLAKGLITEKLAACVNISNVTSIYSWEGKINEDTESLLMIKTKSELVDQLTQYVIKNHPYKVPEVISTSIENGNSAYLDWVRDSVI